MSNLKFGPQDGFGLTWIPLIHIMLIIHEQMYYNPWTTTKLMPNCGPGLRTSGLGPHAVRTNIGLGFLSKLLGLAGLGLVRPHVQQYVVPPQLRISFDIVFQENFLGILLQPHKYLWFDTFTIWQSNFNQIMTIWTVKGFRAVNDFLPNFK